MPPLLLTDLPSTKQLVKASVLAVGLAAAAPGCGDDTTSGPPDGAAPTCGPCCHGSPDCVEDTSVPPPLDSGVEAGPMDASDDASDAASDAAMDGATDATAADATGDAG
jgi:hypothetical protein